MIFIIPGDCQMVFNRLHFILKSILRIFWYHRLILSSFLDFFPKNLKSKFSPSIHSFLGKMEKKKKVCNPLEQNGFNFIVNKMFHKRDNYNFLSLNRPWEIDALRSHDTYITICYIVIFGMSNFKFFFKNLLF